MFCPRCGTQIPQSSRFCFQCGVDVQAELEDIRCKEDRPVAHEHGSVHDQAAFHAQGSLVEKGFSDDDENYAEGSGFRSSGVDGFMRECINLPHDRVVSCAGIPDKIAAITEFVSVCTHACARFEQNAHSRRERVLIVGDGSLAYIMACTLRESFPDMHITIAGHHREKMRLFSFVNATFVSEELPEDLMFDHAFECTGGRGSRSAIDLIIDHVSPQACVCLMGVSEDPVPINTRMVLEKGLTFVGSSRSGRRDFERAVDMMRHTHVQARISRILYEADPICSLAAMKQAFAVDLLTPFKTVFSWQL